MSSNVKDVMDTITQMMANGQFAALAITIGCVVAIFKAAQTVLRVFAGIAALLALIYFFDPAFYSSVANMLVELFHHIVGVSLQVTGG